jgi:hypothetical protein
MPSHKLAWPPALAKAATAGTMAEYAPTGVPAYFFFTSFTVENSIPSARSLV